MEVPDIEAFNELKAIVFEIKRENDFLRSLLLGRRWLSRQETLKVLDVSEATLWRLTKSNSLTHCHEGKKILYEIEGVRKYLTDKKISLPVAQDRIIHALYAA